MAGVSATISVGIQARLTGTTDVASPAASVLVDEVLRLAEGTGLTSQANLMFADQRTITASSSEDLDLAGSLSSPLGATLTFAEVVLIYVKAASTNVNNVVLGAASANDFIGPFSADGTYSVKPGEYALFVSQSGWGVTAGTADLLKVANSSSGTSVVYDIIIIGRTVAA